MFFEELGFRYFGPIDGHDLTKLADTLRFVRRLKGPRVVHVLTEKGKGFSFAEANREKWHGLAAYDPETGEARKKASGPPTWTQVFGDGLTALAHDHSDFVVITAAMPSGTGTNIFQKSWPERFFDVGIAEGHAVTFAGGLATQGVRPVCAIYSTFLQRAYVRTVPTPGHGRDGDLFDLAWLELSPDYLDVLGAVAWLRPGDVSCQPGPDALGSEGTRYLLVGYPSTKLKWRPSDRVFDAQPVVFECHAQPQTSYDRFGRSPVSHLILEFPRRRARSAEGERTLPNPRGVSGGAVFRMPPIRPLLGGSMGYAQLAAVFTDWPVEDRSVLLATRLSVAIEGFRQQFPHLQDYWQSLGQRGMAE